MGTIFTIMYDNFILFDNIIDYLLYKLQLYILSRLYYNTAKNSLISHVLYIDWSFFIEYLYKTTHVELILTFDSLFNAYIAFKIMKLDNRKYISDYEKHPEW